MTTRPQLNWPSANMLRATSINASLWQSVGSLLISLEQAYMLRRHHYADIITQTGDWMADGKVRLTLVALCPYRAGHLFPVGSWLSVRTEVPPQHHL